MVPDKEIIPPIALNHIIWSIYHSNHFLRVYVKTVFAGSAMLIWLNLVSRKICLIYSKY